MPLQRPSTTLCRVALAFVVITISLAAKAQTYTIIHEFQSPSDGLFPSATLTLDAAGNLYGTTLLGGSFGAFECAEFTGCGVVFKLDGNGNYSLLHTFAARSVQNGAFPGHGALIFDAAGNLWGTTELGGNINCYYLGCGTVFEVTPKGKAVVKYEFTGQNGQGGVLIGGLVGDGAGNYYGTTNDDGLSMGDLGTVFKLDASGVETVLYRFQAPPDGERPESSLVRDAGGNLYGTTPSGGANNAGTVFKVAGAGKETVLHSFGAPTDGYEPTSELVADSAGNLYGTTYGGGNPNCALSAGGCGTVFQINPSTGAETILYSFSGTDGGFPVAGLAIDSAGNLYGTTRGGGVMRCLEDFGCGTVFKLAPNRVLTVLHAFQSDANGSSPTGGLVLDKAGNIYGTTSGGGVPTCDCGLIFKITP